MMLTTIVLTILNTLLIVMNRSTRIPGVDIIPAGAILIAAAQEPLFAGTTLLLAPFVVFYWPLFAKSWVALPVLYGMTLFVWIGLAPGLALFLYYVLSTVLSVWMGQVGAKFGMFLVVNSLLNVIVLALWNAF